MTDLFTHAEQRRDRGMGRAADAQDREAPDWGDNTFAVLERLARSQAKVHVDDLLPLVPPPAHPNAFGAVWMRAIRKGLIWHSGNTKPSTDPRKNAHRYPIYDSLIFEGNK